MSLNHLPDSATVSNGQLEVAGIDLESLARRFGTPLYVHDRSSLVTRARAYAGPVHAAGGRVAYACKANPTPAILRELRACGLHADVASAGELAAAVRAGFTGAELIVHGNAKSDVDIEAALDVSASLVVIDNLEEAGRLAAAATARGLVQKVLVRITPGIDVVTHDKVRTGHEGSKFGLEADVAAELIHHLPAGLSWEGLHVHLGSQVLDARPLVGVVQWLATFASRERLVARVVDVGGGLGIGYGADAVDPDPARLAREIVDASPAAFARHGLPAPTLILEPGRSIVARAAVAVYRVLSVKPTSTGTTWVAVDGGLADNPRPAMYDAVYSPLIAGRADAAPTGLYAVAGRHCESGDILVKSAGLPDPRPGDLLVMPMAGAYQESMASNYNLFPRPAAIMVDDGNARLITRRETVEDMLSRDYSEPSPSQ